MKDTTDAKKNDSANQEHGEAHEALPGAVGGRAGAHVSARLQAVGGVRRRRRSPEKLAAACAGGDRAAAAQLISLLESADSTEAAAAAAAAAHLPLPEQVVGITGPPGAGKSTLIDYLVDLLRKSGRHPAVLAVDPSSPFTGGALLGDRIRMTAWGGAREVFVRSMAGRDAGDGLAAAAGDALRILGGAGFDLVILETVGAGQSETEIVALADTVALLQVPGTGDEVQLMKRGILETADIFIVHKSDLPGAAELQESLREMLDLLPTAACRVLRQLGPDFSFSGRPWKPALVAVSSLERKGGEELRDALFAHREFLRQPDLAAALRRDHLCRELLRRAGRSFRERLARELQPDGRYAALLADCLAGRRDVASVAEELVAYTP